MLKGWLSAGHPSIVPSLTRYLAQLGHGRRQERAAELLHGADCSWEGWGRENGSNKVDSQDPGEHFFLTSVTEEGRRERVSVNASDPGPASSEQPWSHPLSEGPSVALP